MLLFDTVVVVWHLALYIYIPEHIPFKFSQTFDIAFFLKFYHSTQNFILM